MKDAVEGQVRTYNKREVDALVAWYAESVVVEDGDGAVLWLDGDGDGLIDWVRFLR
jgi:hypothetical protein